MCTRSLQQHVVNGDNYSCKANRTNSGLADKATTAAGGWNREQRLHETGSGGRPDCRRGGRNEEENRHQAKEKNMTRRNADGC